MKMVKIVMIDLDNGEIIRYSNNLQNSIKRVCEEMGWRRIESFTIYLPSQCPMEFIVSGLCFCLKHDTTYGCM